MSTQRERVLAALRHAGPTGLTQIDFFAPQVCDHGPPITRLAARIGELRDEGHTITSSGTRNGCAVYVLRTAGVTGEPGGQNALGAGITADGHAATGLPLDSPVTPAPRCAIYDYEDAA